MPLRDFGKFWFMYSGTKLRHRIPGLRRLYAQRDEARRQTEQIRAERDIALAEIDQIASADRRGREAADELKWELEEARRQAQRLEEERDHYAEQLKSLFVPPGHFYSPVVNTREAEQHLLNKSLQLFDRLPGITIDRAKMVETWMELLPFLSTAPFPATRNSEFRYAFENDAYSWGDGSVLHAMIRRFMPKRYIEIGSGWSSVCAIDTLERHCAACRSTFIEPYPQLLKELVGPTSLSVEIAETNVQNIPTSLFDTLEANDILFIDSTHVLRTASDVCFELFEIMPRIKSGVLIHIHDIFWPFEYPKPWVVDENRSWNEIYAVRAFLMDNEAWEILFFNHYFFVKESALIESTYPNFVNNCGGALWLRRR